MQKSLMEICDITTGKLDSNASVPNGDYPFYTCAPNSLRTNTFAFDTDAILLAGNNAQGNFHINRFKGKFDAYQRTYVITAKEGYDIDYVYYSLKQNLNIFKQFSQGSQTKFLTMGILNQFQIEDLELDVQRRNIEILKLIDEKIRNNKKINEQIERIAMTLYQYWFVQFEFPNLNRQPYKSTGGEMTWNETLQREIPIGWEMEDIVDLCDIVDCLHSKKPEFHYEDEKYYLLTLENLDKNGYIDLTDKFYISKKDYEIWTKRITVQEDDFVITNAGRAGAIGKIPEGVTCALGRNFTAVRPKNINPVYLRQFFGSDFMKVQILSNLDSGSFFKSLNVKSIKILKILVPDEQILNEYIKIVSPLVEKIENNNRENNELVLLREFLLPMLMNGQASFK